ncbi:1-phosphofructokinase [Heliobacterium gestii]|uniref:Tagatose-6-phosphate kinase n=1 Tax=Heliomicrobium gestii TaxID=2699 RepID=A0A845LP10_HELGE|nr:1-phosphofructokinase [Heliomicrobium gestii]MBM7868443.1 tagatose 6-phosphate kinase [Heliomicrobium gestii]MZP44616.1 1-phosphofructokinase [Heliomicrobium gestii]
MILTVTLNAAIDKTYRVERFQVGDVKRVKKVIATAGGKGLNVARVIHALGEPVLATGFAGGFAGRFIETKLDEQQVAHDFVRLDGESRTCINIIDEATGVQTEVLEPGPSVSPADTERLLARFQAALERCTVVTLSGSLPQGIDRDIYTRLIALAKGAGKKVILDTSGEPLAKGMEAAPTLIKPNRDEVGQLLGHRIRDAGEAARAVRELLALGPENAAISLGSEGVVLGWGPRLRDSKGSRAGSATVLWAKPPAIEPVNTVGCGDAMVAAFALVMSRGYAAEAMVRFAVAVSTASALTAETGGCCVDDVANLMERVEVRQLGR